MVPLAAADTLQGLAARYSPTRMRTIEASLEQFADHGVSGTSLQTIADSLGVTKAAIYHQFPTKDAIVVADRRVLGTLQRDPVLLRHLAAHEASRRMWIRLFSVLLGDDLDAPARVRAAVLSAAIGSVDHPFVADLDDDALRDELLAIT